VYSIVWRLLGWVNTTGDTPSRTALPQMLGDRNQKWRCCAEQFESKILQRLHNLLCVPDSNAHLEAILWRLEAPDCACDLVRRRLTKRQRHECAALHANTKSLPENR